jgi:hypothetical protein
MSTPIVETVGLPIFTFVSGEGETLLQALSAPGFNIRTTISTATRIDVVADQLQVAVSEAVSAAPGPGSLLLMSAGLLGFAILRQRKRIGV